MYGATIFHGSNAEVAMPRLPQHGQYRDFGYGCYCTHDEQSSRRRALTRRGSSVLNSYTYSEHPQLKLKIFSEMTDEWLDFVAACRLGTPHRFDVVAGPMADDQIWNYVEALLAGRISRAAFWELAKFNHPTHQLAFCTELSLQTLSFTGSVAL